MGKKQKRKSKSEKAKAKKQKRKSKSEKAKAEKKKQEKKQKRKSKSEKAKGQKQKREKMASPQTQMQPDAQRDAAHETRINNFLAGLAILLVAAGAAVLGWLYTSCRQGASGQRAARASSCSPSAPESVSETRHELGAAATIPSVRSLRRGPATLVREGPPATWP